MAKRVVRYLKDIMDMSLIFGWKIANHLLRKPPPYSLVGYADSNFAGDLEDRKLVLGYCFFINGAVVSWTSKKQRTVSTLTTEVKYIALRHIAREAVWIRQFINGFNLETIEGLKLYSDNKMSIAFTKNVESQYHTKYINVQYHHIRKLVNEKELTIKCILDSEILDNGMTKKLPIEIFRKLRALLGMAI